MDPRLQRRVQRYGWDKAAAVYERHWAAQLAPAQRALLEMAALAPGERVLDAACGTGLVTFSAARAVGPTGVVFATDISDAMVQLVDAEARRRDLSNVSASRMDAESFDLPDASFDAVLCALGLMYVPDPDTALGEMRRVLKPGGRAVAAVWGARSRCGWADIFPIVDARVQSEVCPMFFQLGTGDNLRAALSRAGLTDIETRRLATTLHYESAEDACGAAFAGGPVALAYSRFDQKTRDEAHAEYLASIESWRRGAQYDVPGEFVVASGVRERGAVVGG
jgi:ubiquinone/menaquinone biosynthesis C-methylase UbiE